MEFDPYHKWLGIPPEEQPPHHYRLLGLKLFESDADVIDAAVERNLVFLRQRATGERGRIAQPLLNQITRARRTLLSPESKAAYDRELATTLRAPDTGKPGPVSAASTTFDSGSATELSGNDQIAQSDRTGTLAMRLWPTSARGRLTVIGSSAAAALLIGVVAAMLRSGGVDDNQPTDDTVAGSTGRDVQTAPASSEKAETSDGTYQNVEDAPVAANRPNDGGKVTSGFGSNWSSTGGGKIRTGTTPAVSASDGDAGTAVGDGDPGEAVALSSQGDASSTVSPAAVESPADGSDDGTTTKTGAEESPAPPPDLGVEEKSVADSRLSLPSAQQRQASEDQLVAIYENELAEARTPQAKSALAQRLLERGKEEGGTAAERYVLLRTSIDLAAKSGDGATALAGVHQLEKMFQLDSLRLKVDVALNVSTMIRTPDANRGMARFVLELIGTAIEQDRYEEFDRVSTMALSAARKSGDRLLLKQVGSRLSEAKSLKQAYSEIVPHLKQLKVFPLDPDANLAVGRYLCFRKGQWSEGLPLLAKSGDPTLGRLAELELKNPDAAEQQVAIADGYWQLADKTASVAERSTILFHAAQWYYKALDQLQGFAKDEARKKLDELARNEGLGVIVEGDVALASAGAKLLGSVTTPEAILDGVTANVGYSKTPETWVVELADVFALGELRLKLYNPADTYFFRYAIDTSIDGKKFVPLVNNSRGEWRGWQVFRMDRQAVRYIRIYAIYGSVSDLFYVCEVEAYCDGVSPPPLD